jgi:hypothetical protein
MGDFKWVRYIIVMAIFIVLSGCSNQNHPKKNPHPKYFVTISGHINPSLSKRIYLGFWARYGAYNPKCSIWINRFEGVKGMPAKTFFFQPKPGVRGDYVINIPIDHYENGQCDWKIAEVDMTASFKYINAKLSKNDWNWQVIVFGMKDEGLPGLPINKNFTATLDSNQCFKRGFSYCGDTLSGAPSQFNILRNNSYHFIQNIQ